MRFVASLFASLLFMVYGTLSFGMPAVDISGDWFLDLSGARQGGAIVTFTLDDTNALNTGR